MFRSFSRSDLRELNFLKHKMGSFDDACASFQAIKSEIYGQTFFENFVKSSIVSRSLHRLQDARTIMTANEFEVLHKSIAYLVQRPTFNNLDLTEDKEDKKMME